MEIFTVYAPIVISAAAFAVSIYNYKKQQSAQAFAGIKDFNESWATLNTSLLTDPHFVKFERELHPHGELSEEGVKRVYFYFMRFNAIYAAYRGKGELDDALSLSAFNNEANLSFHDQDFIRKHVFNRGYDAGFAEKFEDKWRTITKTQKTLKMYGDTDGNTVSPLRPKVSH